MHALHRTAIISGLLLVALILALSALLLTTYERPTTLAQSSVPAKITGLTATAGNFRVYLSWNNPNDASITKYEFKAKLTSQTWNDVNWQTLQNVDLAGYKAHVLVTNGDEWGFRIRAVNSNGNGPESDPASTTPSGSITNPTNTPAASDTPAATNTSTPPPTPVGAPRALLGLRADKPASEDTVTLRFTIGINHNSESFQYRWRRKGQDWSDAIAISLSTSSTRNSTLATTNFYHGEIVDYQVRAINSNGAGAWSPIATATIVNADNQLVVISRSTASMVPAASVTYGVKLAAAVAGTVNISSSDTDKATVAPKSLEFTTSGLFIWSRERNVAITGVEDGSANITHSFTFDGASEIGIPNAGTISVTVAENTATPTPTATATNTPVPTDTPTATATNTPAPTNTPTPTATNTPAPTDTPTATSTPAPTDTPTATSTPDPSASATPTATSTPTNTPAPTNTPTATNTPDPAATATSTPTPSPSVPINVQVAVDTNGTAATVTWQSGGSGVNGNCPTVRYDLTLRNHGDNTDLDQTSTETQYRFTGLTPTNEYTVYIYAYGGISCNVYSDDRAALDFTATTADTTFTATPTATPTGSPTPTATATPTGSPTATPTPSIRPNTVANINVEVAATGTSATVKWLPGGNGIGGNCPTTRYQVFLNVNGAWQAANNGRAIPHPTNGQPTLELTGLTSGDSYIVRVDAYGSVCGKWSSTNAMLSFTATPSTIFGSATPTPTNTPDPSASATPTPVKITPNNPINIQVAVNSDGTSATVSWESGGSGVGGNCPTTRYDLTLQDLTDSSVNLLRQSITAPTTTQTVTLTAGHDYNVQVYALGISCETYSVLPANLYFTATASTTFTPSPIPSPTPTPSPTSTATNTPTATATNTPDPSASATPTPVKITPSKPINIQVAVDTNGTAATVTWQSGGSGVNGNCPTTSYDLTLYNSIDDTVKDTALSVTATQHRFTGLTPTNEYLIEIYAYGRSCDDYNNADDAATLTFTATTADTTFTATPTPLPTATPTITNTPDPSASATPTPEETTPSELINLQVTVNSDGTGATVSWESGGSGVGGNCPTTLYSLTLYDKTDNSVENVEHEITAPTTTQTLTLTAGHKYDVEVYSYGSLCDNYNYSSSGVLTFTATASTTFTATPTPLPTATPTITNTPDPSASATPTPAEITPSEVINLQVTVNSDGTSATVSWESGGSGVGGNCPTTLYSLTLYDKTDNSVENVEHEITAPTTTQTLTLTAGHKYDVEVYSYGSLCDNYNYSSSGVLTFTATASTTFTATPTPLPTATPTITNTPDPSASATPTRIPAATARPGTSRPRTATPTAVTDRHPVSRIEPAIRGETVISAGNKITLRVMPYGQQNMMDTRLSAGSRGLTWKQGSITLTDDDKRTPWTILYTAPSSPGTYKVTASLPDCTPASETIRDASCSAEFTIRVRRPAPGQADPATPVNPPGNIPALIPDSQGNQYGVFTPVDGGTFDSGEGYYIVAEAGVIPNGEFIGVRMSDQGTASNVGMAHHRYTLGGNIYAISAVDSGGTIVSSYILDKAATVCIPLPAEMRTKLSDVALVVINNDDTLTILSSSVRLNSSGDTMVCGSLSSLPAQIAVGSAGSPAAIPAPTPEPSPLPPETGGATPTSNSIIWVLILGSAIAIFGSTLLIARRREIAKN